MTLPRIPEDGSAIDGQSRTNSVTLVLKISWSVGMKVYRQSRVQRRLEWPCDNVLAGHFMTDVRWGLHCSEALSTYVTNRQFTQLTRSSAMTAELRQVILWGSWQIRSFMELVIFTHMLLHVLVVEMTSQRADKKYSSQKSMEQYGRGTVRGPKEGRMVQGMKPHTWTV